MERSKCTKTECVFDSDRQPLARHLVAAAPARWRHRTGGRRQIGRVEKIGKIFHKEKGKRVNFFFMRFLFYDVHIGGGA